MKKIYDLKNWKKESPIDWGFHKVITPENSDCEEVQIYRLNLKQGEVYRLESGNLEMHPVLIEGKAKLVNNEKLDIEMNQFDSFYIPSNNLVDIQALENCIFYIAGAKCENLGEISYRKFDKTLPIGDIHQIHGEGAGAREVMFTLAPTDRASRIIAGLTWGAVGAWTSWPPHQHEKDLEEVYCYFDMPKPDFGFHISYFESGKIEDAVIHKVSSGSMVQAPCGYHPTVATPMTRNAYFWVLAAFETDRRRYDLAIIDPAYDK